MFCACSCRGDDRATALHAPAEDFRRSPVQFNGEHFALFLALYSEGRIYMQYAVIAPSPPAREGEWAQSRSSSLRPVDESLAWFST